jgi:flagellar hook-length control protein FliK
MPLAPNALLQTNATATTKAASAIQSSKAVETSKDNASSFSDVYSKQAKVKSTDERDTPSKTVRDKAPAEKSKAVADKDKPASDDKTTSTQSTVADSGNTLPVTPVASSDQKSDDSSPAPVDPSLLTDVAPDPTLPVVDPTQDPALLALAAQAAAQPPVEPVVDVTPKPVVDPSAATAAAAAATTVSQATTPTPVAQVTPPAGEKPFDPYADPLEGLSAVQLALENANAKAQSTTQTAQLTNTTAKTGKTPADTGNVDPSQNVANNLTALADQLPVQKSSTESSDKSFGSVIDGGLKDGQAAATDTRVDNFADRLAAMSQAAQQAKVPAAASAAPLINQPLAMHQSGWSEGVVDRVMYLSSQNLKSAQIQLEPAELGRLDIRVNMAQDQQTQVTFMSAHVGVREALESQMGKLRESFNQQGLGQVDVSVADQSRQQSQQQQAQEEQAANAQRSGSGSRNGGSGSGDGTSDDSAIADAAIPLSQPATRVIGTSEVDYYA